MRLGSPLPESKRRWLRLIKLGIVWGFLGAVAMVVPDAILGLPFEIVWPVRTWTPLGLIVGGTVLLAIDPSTLARGMRWLLERPLRWVKGRLPGNWPTAVGERIDPVAARFIRMARLGYRSRAGSWLDRASAWILTGPLTVLMFVLCSIALLGWVPHYLTWPWWCDSDQFAVSALAWNAGLRPYRDLPDFDFPGPIYVFWLLGQLAGWGRTWPLYAADAAALLAWGLALLLWSRRRYHSALPGLCAYAAFLWYYLGLDYSRVAQRDWHAPFLTGLALLALQTWPGRVARAASALAFAAALSVRPQVVLFAPALASAIEENARPDPVPHRSLPRSLFEWLGWLALGLCLIAAPLVWAGVVDDFLRVLHTARYGGSYNRVDLFHFTFGLRRQVFDGATAWLLASNALLALAGPTRQRRIARTWTMALLCVLLYKPLSPVAHGYLDHPRALIWTVNLGVLTGWLLQAIEIVPPLRLAGLGFCLALTLPFLPRYWIPSASVRALHSLAQGSDPFLPPPGCADLLTNGDGKPSHYSWHDYRNVLAYLRQQTTRSTRVANMLRVLPFPALNGPTGRLTPFPAAGGILYVGLIDPSAGPAFARSLASSPDAVIVWIPEEFGVDFTMELPEVVDVIRSLYEPAIRFGQIEVWRRRNEGPHDDREASRHGSPRPLPAANRLEETYMYEQMTPAESL